jgi:7,8-dihydropterin-6-yl-methyl-4-(beta-D-ribofuranosyl)aminobenzene 5'-phosphate synthase
LDKSTTLLKKTDDLEIISLMDNSVDFLSSIGRKEVSNIREWCTREKITKKMLKPIAEHGFSMLIRVYSDDVTHNVLFDAGGSSNGVLENVKMMKIDLSEVEAIAISHGHWDHFGGLRKIVHTINKVGLPIIIHEDMLKTRGSIRSDGKIRRYPDFPRKDEIKPARYVATKEPYSLCDNTVIVTGEIPRITDFEKGYQQHRVFVDGEWKPDPYIWDDRALVIDVKKKGLVIISGCAHAGIINTALYAKKITGVSNILAVIGGFHLAGKKNEGRVLKTINELKDLDPKLIAPSHCTGWRGICAIAEAFPQSFVWNSVGNRYQF